VVDTVDSKLSVSGIVAFYNQGIAVAKEYYKLVAQHFLPRNTWPVAP